MVSPVAALFAPVAPEEPDAPAVERERDERVEGRAAEDVPKRLVAEEGLLSGRGVDDKGREELRLPAVLEPIPALAPPIPVVPVAPVIPGRLAPVAPAEPAVPANPGVPGEPVVPAEPAERCSVSILFLNLRRIMDLRRAMALTVSISSAAKPSISGNEVELTLVT